MRVLENTQIEFVSGGLAAISGGGDDYIDSFEGGGGGGGFVYDYSGVVDAVDFYSKRTSSNMCTPTYSILPDLIITATKIDPIGQAKGEALVSCFQNLTMKPDKATSACANTIKELTQ